MKQAGVLSILASFSLLIASGCGDVNTAEVDDAALRAAYDRVSDWLTHGRTYSEQRFSPLAQISDENVSELGLAWAFDTGSTRGIEATPIVVDGIIYTTGSWSVVFAVDARTGRQIWKWDPEVPRTYGQKACCDVVNRGVAFYRGKVFVGVLDGRLAALDAATGEVVWEVITVDQSEPYTITGAPRVVKGKVIIGNGGAEYGVRGYVSAYDAGTGDLVWRFYTVPGDPSLPFESKAMEEAAKTWNGEWWKIGGGGTVWDSLAYDPDLDLLYVGTGNGSPWDRELRSPGGGDNLYLCAIVALRPDSGELVWYYQTTPGDSWDYTSVQQMILADLEIRGRLRQVLMQAPKNGFFYVLDRATGEFISAEPFVEVTWASRIDGQSGRPIEAPGSRYLDAMAVIRPAPNGAHNWQSMSFNPGTGLVYIPVQLNAMVYLPGRQRFEYRPGAWNLGVEFQPQIPTGVEPSFHLLAWDPVRQREQWRHASSGDRGGGTLTTAGNLLFQGTAEGWFRAYRADNGEMLWETPTGSGILAAPVTYQVDGQQYVSIMVGWGGSFGLNSDTQGATGPRRLLTFRLGGREKLVVPAPPEPLSASPLQVDVTTETFDEGRRLFHRWCFQCHGWDAAGGGVITDLRHSELKNLSAESYSEIVLEGALQDVGMPSFEKWLTADDLKKIRAYTRKRLAEMLSPPSH